MEVVLLKYLPINSIHNRSIFVGYNIIIANWTRYKMYNIEIWPITALINVFSELINSYIKKVPFYNRNSK